MIFCILKKLNFSKTQILKNCHFAIFQFQPFFVLRIFGLNDVFDLMFSELLSENSVKFCDVLDFQNFHNLPLSLFGFLKFCEKSIFVVLQFFTFRLFLAVHFQHLRFNFRLCIFRACPNYSALFSENAVLNVLNLFHKLHYTYACKNDTNSFNFVFYIDKTCKT